MNIEKKLAALEKEIINQADDECKKIREDYELKKDELVAKLELELLAEIYNSIQKEKRRISKEKNNRVLAFSSDAKRKLSLQREKMIDQIFEDVEKKVSAFVESAEYPDYLKKNIDFALSVFQNEKITLILSKNDQKYADELKNYNPYVENVEITADDILGGLRAVGLTSGKIYDNTLKNAIAVERRNFLKNNKLGITG
jgi:vacuolar-type H+-ATPase subunit E/Vma4